MTTAQTSDLWWKNAVIYCLDVEKYQDANGDGIGDFEGLMRRLDYLQGLGVTCVWLQPFYPSPNRDNGYDVSDFYGVHEKHGSLGDFVAFMQHAEASGGVGVSFWSWQHANDEAWQAITDAALARAASSAPGSKMIPPGIR